VVVAGDHIDANGVVPSAVQIAALQASFSAIAQHRPLLVCSGNHDLNARNQAGEKTADWLGRSRSSGLAIDGETVQIGDSLLTVCPWWDGPQAKANLERMLEQASQRRRGDWVWVYHAPPECKLSWTGKRHFGDAFLPELIQRYSPTAVLCGHIHEAPFKSDGGWVDRIGTTWLFNAGRQIGDVPARIEIDFAQGAARWVSLAGVEEQSLL